MIHYKSFLLPTNKGKEFIVVDKIMRIEASSNYSKLFFKDGTTLVVAKVLHWFEDKLGATDFIRVHRSHLINIIYIEQYNRSRTIILNDNSFFTIAKRKQASVKQFLQNNTLNQVVLL
jgi:two-component system, LytTR family, response regulator